MIYRYDRDEAFDTAAFGSELLKNILPELRKHFAFSDEEWQVYEERLSECLPELAAKYFDLYEGCVSSYPLFFDLIECITKNWLERPDGLRNLDSERLKFQDWFSSDQMVGAVCYVDLFAGDLEGLRAKIPYLREMGITYLHLMPVFKAPEGENDGGYAVSSYRELDPRLGTIEQLKSLSEAFHEAGIILVADFIFNHTSSEHIWAQKAKTGDSACQGFYRMYDDRSIPDRYEHSLREIFPDEHPGAFTWFPDIQKWVWTTFHSYQWDLNYHDPEVLIAMADEMLHLANIGVDVLRLDAVAFIWKQMGTVCESLPQAYQLVELFNLIARIGAPSLLFKSEAIVHPDEVIRYIDPKRCQLSYNPLLMALMWESLATRETKLLIRSMQKRFSLPPHTSWVNYVRCHDDIGWTFSDEDASQVGINGYPHRRFLNDFYTGRFPGSFARGLPFQENPHTGDCRISGTMASLAGVEKSLDDFDTKELAFSLDRMTLLFGITMFIGGIPLIYLGDEIAQLNDYSYRDDPEKCSDSRWVHRCSYDLQEQIMGDLGIADEMRSRVKKLVSLRKSHPVFSEQAVEIPDGYNAHTFAFVKRNDREIVEVIVNFSEHSFTLPPKSFECFRRGTIKDLMTGKVYVSGELAVMPYQMFVLYQTIE